MDDKIVEVGDIVTYVDEHSVPHQAIVLINHGRMATSAINVAFVSSDETKTDSYGRQIERASSVSRKSEYTAHGRYYTA